MACRILYDGQEFDSEEGLELYIENQLNANLGALSLLQEADVETQPSTPSPALLARVNEFLKRIGVDVARVKKIVIEGVEYDATARADLLNQVIEIVEGKEPRALGEEAFHFALELIEQTNPVLFNKMMNKVGTYDIFHRVISSETYRKLYKNKDGSIDVREMKKEAIAKVLAETYARQDNDNPENDKLLQQSYTWWQEVVQWLKHLFSKSEFNPFEEGIKIIDDEGVVSIAKPLADRINKAEKRGIFADAFAQAYGQEDYAGAVSMYRQQLEDPETFGIVVAQQLGGDRQLGEDILEFGQSYLQSTDTAARDGLYGRIMETHKKLAKITIQENNKDKEVYTINGNIVKNRVTDLAKEWYETKFKNQQLTKTEQQTANDDLKAEKGTLGHADLEALFHRYVDDEGFIREVPLEMPASVLAPKNPKFIEKLDKYMEKMLATYPVGTRFMAEVQIYDPAGQGRAGTMDFVAILPNGQMDIKDWKFMDVATQEKNVPWYKIEAFNIQLGEYKRILKKNYGVEQFRQTRAIPIKTQYKWADFEKRERLVLAGINIGSVDPKEIKDLTLLPVGTRDETTGNKQLDDLITRLNALYKSLYEQRVAGDQRVLKMEKLNALSLAIRTLQIQGQTKELAKSATAIITSVKRDVDSYLKRLETNSALTTQEKKEVAEKILGDYHVLKLFREIENYFADVSLDEDSRKVLEEVAAAANKLVFSIDKLRGEVGTIIALGYGIKNLLIPEKVVGFMSRNFRSLSQAGTAATRVLWKMVERIAAATEIEYDQEVDRLNKLKDEVDGLAKRTGVDTKDLLKKFLQMNNGKWTGELIRKVSGEFYTQLRAHQNDVDKKWIKQNVDMEAYTKWYEEHLKDYITYQEGQVYSLADEKVNEAERKRRVKDWKKIHDPKEEGAYSKANIEMKRFPKVGDWVSKEYTEIAKEPALLAFYEYWQEKMKQSYKMGMIQDVAYSRFVPNVKKNMLEMAFFGGKNTKTKKTFSFLNAIRTESDDVVRDPFSGEPIDKIAPLYLSDLGERAVDKELGTEYKDYSTKSDDLFKLMAIWNEEMIKYKYRTQIESEARLIQSVEQRKGTVTINKRTKDESISPEDKTNAAYFDNYMNAILYNRKYIERADGSFKFPVNTYIRGINKAFKKTLGFEPLPLASQDVIDVSTTKTVESLNRWFQMKTLGFNVVSALSNLVGGTANAYIKAGTWFNKKDLFEGETRLASQKMHTPDGHIAAGLVNYFIPLTDSERREKAADLSVKGAVANMSSDWLFYLQRKSERWVQLPVFWAFCKNTMVEGGELVNIRDYVRQQNGYNSMYQLTPGEVASLNQKMEREIEELIKTRSLFKISTIENDELVIPGIDRNSDTVYKFRNKVQQFSKDILGNMDPNDIYQYRMNLLLKSMMMFKNWIPRMIDVRFGGLRYEVGKDDWEWGRVSMLRTALMHNLWHGARAFIGIAGGKQSLIEKAKQVYIQKQAEFGSVDFMSEAAFVDMYVAGATQSVRELLMWISLAGLLYAAGSAVPDDDDEVAKGAHKWGLRLLDKAQQELSFFYNPISMTAVANGNMWPALQTVVELERFAQNALADGFYTITGNQKGQEDTKTLKYLFKALPITKELATYMAIFSHELATDYGITVSSQARGR